MSEAVKKFHTLPVDAQLATTAHLLGDLDAPLLPWCETCQGRRAVGHVCVAPPRAKRIRRRR